MSFQPHSSSQPVSDINVTPFVDVLLVLLVIFMITAPIINHMVQVELPKDSYSQEGHATEQNLKVIIDAQGIIYVGEQRIGASLEGDGLGTFQQALEVWTAQQPAPWFIDLEADKQVSYGNMIPVITRLKEMNIGMNLIIQPRS